MANLTSLEKEFDDQLTCSVCLDQYTNPKTLPCLHSFCLKCIEPLPTEIKDGKHYINCPTCHIDYQVPEGSVQNLPNALQINSLLELRKKLDIEKSTQMNCHMHNDPLKVYCETCCEVICRDCTISKEHNKHNFELISECFSKHHQQIQADLDLLKCKTADINTAVTALVTREKEVVKQGEEVKKEIYAHAQQLIDQVRRSERHLLQHVDVLVQQKRHFLIKQREQAERFITQLKTCEETVKNSLKEWSQQQVMMEKQKMLYQMKTVSQYIEPKVLHAIEKADMRFKRTNTIENEIGELTSETYGKAIFEVLPCTTKKISTATLTLQSHDGSPFSLPPSLISCKLFSPSDIQNHIKCDINQTQQGKYNISFTPCTTGGHQLTVQVGGVDISGSPFTLTVIPSREMRGKPVKTVTRLNTSWGIAVCDNGDIVVVEGGAHCVTTVNKKGKRVRSFGAWGTNKGQFICPRGIAISNDGHILVTDKHRLQKLTFDGVCVKSVGSKKCGSGQLEFDYPIGITVHPTTGQVFVADSDNNRIQVFNCDLTFSYTITLHGSNQFDLPYDTSLDNEGCLYIAERGNNCITKLALTGRYITRFGSEGSAPGQLCMPSSLTINNNLVYIDEACNHRVSIFDTKGTFLHCFGKRGSGEGELENPRGITIDTLGNLYVSDTGNNRIVIF